MRVVAGIGRRDEPSIAVGRRELLEMTENLVLLPVAVVANIDFEFRWRSRSNRPLVPHLALLPQGRMHRRGLLALTVLLSNRRENLVRRLHLALVVFAHHHLISASLGVQSLHIVRRVLALRFGDIRGSVRAGVWVSLFARTQRQFDGRVVCLRLAG